MWLLWEWGGGAVAGCVAAEDPYSHDVDASFSLPTVYISDKLPKTKRFHCRLRKGGGIALLFWEQLLRVADAFWGCSGSFYRASR